VLSREYLLLENGSKDVVTPIKNYKRNEKFRLMRKMK
jgi:hypothetical protein